MVCPSVCRRKYLGRRMWRCRCWITWGWTMRIFSDEASFVITLRFAPCPLAALYWILRGVFFHAKGSFCDLYQWETGGLFAPAYRVSQIPAAAAALSSQKQRNVFARANLFLGRGANAVIFSQRDIFLALKQQQIQPYKLFLRKNRRWKLF